MYLNPESLNPKSRAQSTNNDVVWNKNKVFLSPCASRHLGSRKAPSGVE